MERLLIEFEQEDDGRWIADVVALPGVMAYGVTQDEALRKVRIIALHVLAEMAERNEEPACRVIGELFAEAS